MKIPLTKPYVSREEESALSEVIRSGWITQGEKVAEFENRVANYVNAKYAIATTSCTTALQLCLEILGVKKGDEVILPSFTYIATANVVLHCGAIPVFIDIESRTYNIDPCQIEKAITKKTKAIIPVHQVGLPVDMDRIKEIAEGHNLHVIEDAACALGSEYKNKKIGSISKFSCFSFHPRKIVTTGEGGMITTDDREFFDRAKILRSHGMSLSDVQRHKIDRVVFEEYNIAGHNYRMTDLQAAIGIEQMKKINEILRLRRRIAERYTEEFKNIKYFQCPFEPEYAKHNYQSYIIKVDKRTKKSRDQIMIELQKLGISTRRGVMAIHLQNYYQKKFKRLDLPITEEAYISTITLPLYPSMSDKEQEYVIDSVKKIIR